jgi:hypothetical protein
LLVLLDFLVDFLEDDGFFDLQDRADAKEG